MSFFSKCRKWVAEKVEAAWQATKRFFSAAVERVLDFCHATAEAAVVAALVSGKANVAKVATNVAGAVFPQKALIAAGGVVKAGLLKAGCAVTASALTLGTGAAAILVAIGFIALVRAVKNATKKPVEQSMSDVEKTIVAFEEVAMAA